MKRHIITGISIIVCVALCAVMWPRSAMMEDLPAETDKTVVNAEIKAQSDKMSQILFSAVTPDPGIETITENEPEKTETTAEKDIEPASPAKPTSHVLSKSAHPSNEPKPGDRTVIDGTPLVWIPGFGWIKDEGGGSVGTTVGTRGDELTGKKAGVMGGGTTVDGKGNINKQVGIMSGGTVAEDMYENGHKIGIMGSEESAPHETTDPPAEQPVPTGNVVYIELQPPVTKDSTPPPYKPNGEPTNP